MTMQAIQVKYLSATNQKGSRIKAWCYAGSLTIPYPHELSGQAVYRKAAEALAKKLGWLDDESGADFGKTMLGGCLPDESYCFIFDHPVSRD